MNSNEKDFFNQAKNHSKIKLIILEKFFPSWATKVFYNPFNEYNNELIVFDGFAGPGEYDTGEKGSPLICLENTFKLINQRKRIKDQNNKKMKISLLFCEKNDNNYKKLCNKIEKRGFHLYDENKSIKWKKYSALNQKITVAVTNSNFSDCFNTFTKRRNDKYKYNPCFSFIDPFGYKDIKFLDIINFLNAGKTDIILNMIYEHLNRFLGVENQSLNETYKKFLGASDEEFKVLQKKLIHAKSFERVEIVTEFYKEKLKKEKFYVSKIKIKNGNKVKMVLFYISKNIKGFNLFKEIKFQIECSLEKNGQLHLKDKTSLEKDEIKNFLKINFYPEFDYNDICKEIERHDSFIVKNLNRALQEMRKDKKIEIFENNEITNKKLKNTKIKFLERIQNEQNKNRMDRSNLESNNRLF